MRLRQDNEEYRTGVREHIVGAARRRIKVETGAVPRLLETHAPFENEHLLTRWVHMPWQAGIGVEPEKNCASTRRGIVAE